MDNPPRKIIHIDIDPSSISKNVFAHLPVVGDVGEAPAAETMLDLGQTVADTRASTDPASTITVIDGPTVGDLGEITIDVMGLGDDAAVGVRLHVFGQPDESGDGFNLKGVEETALCGRGVTDEGACV